MLDRLPVPCDSEGFLPSHSNQILKEFEKNNHLKIRTISGEARKRGYYLNHIYDERVGILYEQHKN